MNRLLIFISLLTISFVAASFLGELKKANYAVLIAASNEYWNYRHQADIFHAYHILLKNGMPKENIILFAYDDIAYNSLNPFKGKVFNKPSEGPGQDYYEGVNIDYKGEDVSPENFLKVLLGDKNGMKGIGSGRVLESGSNDNVFINFVDHGSFGCILFPSNKFLYADELNNTLKQMHQNQKFNKLVFYLDANESGSMFEDILPESINIYASTACKSNEYSYGCYCDQESKVNGKYIGPCIGDLYSVTWMEDSDLSVSNETIEDQFELISKKLAESKSHPTEFGDKSFKATVKVTDFQGGSESQLKRVVKTIDVNTKKYFAFEKNNLLYLDYSKKKSVIKSSDIKLNYLLKKLNNTNDESDLLELKSEEILRQTTDSIFDQFSIDLNLDIENNSNKNINFDCLRKSVNLYVKVCKNFTEYNLKYIKYLSVACNTYLYETIQKKIEMLC